MTDIVKVQLGILYLFLSTSFKLHILSVYRLERKALKLSTKLWFCLRVSNDHTLQVLH